MPGYPWISSVTTGALITPQPFIEITDAKDYIVEHHCPSNYMTVHSSYNGVMGHSASASLMEFGFQSPDIAANCEADLTTPDYYAEPRD